MKPATLVIIVRGTPAPQGSKSAFRNQHTGKIQQVESSKAVKPWRLDVKVAALEAIEAKLCETPGVWCVLKGPLMVSMVFSFNRPKGHWGTGRNADLLKTSAPNYPYGRPDLSKLARSTEDALTDVVWADDAQIVSYRRLAKHYSGSSQSDVLAHPGAVIRVWSLSSVATSHHRDAVELIHD